MAFWKPGQAPPATPNDKSNEQKKETNGVKTNSTPTKLTLSKSVTSMKFMKKREVQSTSNLTDHTSSPNDQQQPESSSNEDIASENLNESTSSSQYVLESVDYLSALPGRRSFKNMNSVVEKYYQSKLDELNFHFATLSSSSSTSSTTKADQQLSKQQQEEQIIDNMKYLSGLPRGPNQSRIDIKQSSTTTNKNKMKQHFNQQSNNVNTNSNNNNNNNNMNKSSTNSISRNNQLHNNNAMKSQYKNNSFQNTNNNNNKKNNNNNKMKPNMHIIKSKYDHSDDDDDNSNNISTNKYPMKKIKR